MREIEFEEWDDIETPLEAKGARRFQERVSSD
jgi:hypothetical protein